MKKKILLLDLCHTLVDGNTTFVFLDAFLKHNKRYQIFKKIKSLFIIRVILKLCFKLGFDLNRKLAVFFLRGVCRDDLLLYATRMAKEEFIYNQDILDVTGLIDRSNVDVYILSASLDFIVEAVAKQFNFGFISTTMKYSDGVCSGCIDNDILFKKDQMLTELLSKHHYNDGTYIIFVSDNVEDFELLNKVDLGLAFINKSNSVFFSKRKMKAFSKQELIEALNLENCGIQ